jgi:hypothetical protein
MDWNKIGALASVGCFLLGCFAWYDAHQKTLETPAVPPLILVFGGCFIVAGVLNLAAARLQFTKRDRSAGGAAGSDLVLKAIWETIRIHSRVYKDLAFTYPDKSRYPLNHSSWPNFGSPWEHLNAALYAESIAFERTRAVMKAAWVDMGWPATQEIFTVSSLTTMPALLTALDDCDYFLRSKVRVLGT